MNKGQEPGKLSRRLSFLSALQTRFVKRLNDRALPRLV
jgi:hypothetical protein